MTGPDPGTRAPSRPPMGPHGPPWAPPNRNEGTLLEPSRGWILSNDILGSSNDATHFCFFIDNKKQPKGSQRQTFVIVGRSRYGIISITGGFPLMAHQDHPHHWFPVQTRVVYTPQSQARVDDMARSSDHDIRLPNSWRHPATPNSLDSRRQWKEQLKQSRFRMLRVTRLT